MCDTGDESAILV